MNASPSVFAGLTLRVRNRDTMLAFYHDLLGLDVIESAGNRVVLAPGGRCFVLTLVNQEDAPIRPRLTLGLFHWAIVLPNRQALSAVIRRLLETRYPNMQGTADHGVSEAVYLSDPEGNGIELYTDRPRHQ